jgi:hypothetical protein
LPWFCWNIANVALNNNHSTVVLNQKQSVHQISFKSGGLMPYNIYTVELVQSDILWHQSKMYGPKVFLLTEIKPEYSDILYNRTHFPGPLVCWIRLVLTSCTIWHISLVPCCVGLDWFWHPVQSDTFPWSLGVLD